MARLRISIKHLQINRANKTVIVATSAAVAVVVFGMFIARGLLQRQGHQARVIKEKETAVRQLKTNLEATNQIVNSYRLFTSSAENVLGGSTLPDATGDRDGDNARLVLDALPSKYDFPALATSLEKILTDNHYKIEAINGTDDEINQSTVQAQANPQPVEMPFTIAVSSSYTGVQQLVSLFEGSIRPFKMQSIDLSGDNNTMKLTLKALTYYQPEKTVSITKKAVK
jgi:hypothetical protein